MSFQANASAIENTAATIRNIIIGVVVGTLVITIVGIILVKVYKHQYRRNFVPQSLDNMPGMPLWQQPQQPTYPSQPAGMFPS